MAEPTTRQLLEHIHQLLHHDQYGLEAILAGQRHLERRIKRIMATLADIKAQSESLIASVAAETDLVIAIKTYVEGLKAQMTDLADKLAAALAASDPAALQAVSDDLTNAARTIDSNKAAEAAVVNTPTP